ncbi:hypothetical protein ROLI_013960 [Roseobacter fucihabitans]|uniref:Metallo-beta-lactamase domain-containing protein n=1 Tax=Roseobacter fucihabitans TaxID=1537242 RepID=A0ABZ2BQQ6_9RHOB|nr:hypothetical protein [Roseobacter litoralis]MBC6967508.1 hypothetical protein [Roseobacter litoralis]
MTIQPFSPVGGLDGVYIGRAGKLNCIVFRLRDGSICLYSPVAGLETSGRDSLAKLGDVSMILAPNHYHNKGLTGHANAFPNASLVCSKGAEPRLKKITGLTFDPIDILKSKLADNQRILEPEGLKTGEVWIEVRTRSEIAWIVTDTFSAKLHSPGVCAEAPSMLGTFPRYGVKDAWVFKDWANTQLSTDCPTILLSCHGSPVKAPDLDAQLIGLLADAF